MKRILSLALAVIVSATAAFAAKTTIAPADMPRSAQYYIEKNFGKNVIDHVRVDRGTFGIKEYEVILKNGTEIEFNRDGAPTEIESRAKGLPKSVVPTTIADYCKRYFPKQKIVKLEIERRGYKVGLGNGAELVFDASGRFMRLDD